MWRWLLVSSLVAACARTPAASCASGTLAGQPWETTRASVVDNGAGIAISVGDP
jgi:hypothetical protein